MILQYLAYAYDYPSVNSFQAIKAETETTEAVVHLSFLAYKEFGNSANINQHTVVTAWPEKRT